MAAYYNEIDPFAARWLRELIKNKLIAVGDVDERSIDDVRADDLVEYAQCHFFAGIGGWSCALRRAGWPDDKPVWTGSCPCQPFSTAGKGVGFDDERHLWPSFHWLIEQCRPPIVFGEQVASKAAEPWIDLVQADVEAMGYAFGCVPFPSAGVGAPHIRDRAYWVANSNNERSQGWQERWYSSSKRPAGESCVAGGVGHSAKLPQRACNGKSRSGPEIKKQAGRSGIFSGVGNPGSKSGERNSGAVHSEEGKGTGSRGEDGRLSDRHTNASEVGRVAESNSNRCEARSKTTETSRHGDTAKSNGALPANGFWRDADWIGCRDGKLRPVEPGASPLADGVPARVGRLRGYGNAINIEAAKIFIEQFSAACCNTD